MVRSKTIGVLFCFLLVAESVLFCACRKPGRGARETTTASQEKRPGSTTAEQPDFSPPEPAEVREAVARVYQNVVTLEENRGTGFIAGDFNDWRRKADRSLQSELGLFEVFSAARGRPARTFPAVLPVFRLDRIYARGLQVVDIDVHYAYPLARLSDHAALLVDLEDRW